VYAGVTVESAAKANSCTAAEITQALILPEARLIEPASEWDAVDLLAAEFRETPDILAGVVPVGVTLISAAPKVGKTRLHTQLAVAAVRGSMFLNRVVTPTKVLTLALEDGARRYRKSLDHLVWDNPPARDQLRIRTTSKRFDDGGITAVEQHLDLNPECRLVIIDVLERVRPRGRGTNAYRLDYEALAPLQRMANLRQIAIVVVHQPTNAPKSQTCLRKCRAPPVSSASLTASYCCNAAEATTSGCCRCRVAKLKIKKSRLASTTVGGDHTRRHASRSAVRISRDSNALVVAGRGRPRQHRRPGQGIRQDRERDLKGAEAP
jgi:predicted anti-sigma-YlaC factor YlaD